MEEERAEIDGDVADAVGEMTNIICGRAKSKLGKLNLKFDLATPTIINGRNLQIHYQINADVIVIPFSSAYGDFVIEANLGLRMKFTG